MLYHFPIEPYIERYTAQLCGEGVNGWLESRWIESNIPFIRIAPDNKQIPIKNGSVLDACRRGIWCSEQNKMFLNLLNEYAITSDDILYFADFWHPGIEAFAYAFHIMGIKPKMFAFCHAQSVDENDFTFEMLPWIRHYEKGNGAILDGIFVNCQALKNLLVKQGIAATRKIHVCGHIYNSDKVKELFPSYSEHIVKKNQVVFSSRWDKEKDPLLFLKLAAYYRHIDPEMKFIVSTSSPTLRSNDPYLLHELNKYEFDNLEVRTDQSKTDYYGLLLESKFQFNCAHQDFISYCLLEALTCKCIPIYPNYLSFPEVLPREYLYDKGDYMSAVALLYSYQDEQFDPKLEYIYKTHDITWELMLRTMEANHV